MNGRPIGYELFPGNTFEGGKTLESSLDKLSVVSGDGSLSHFKNIYLPY
jgi:hypothetical protein